MKLINIALLLSCVVFNVEIASACTEMSIYPEKPKLGELLTLFCKTEIEVKQVAADIIGDHWNAAFPELYDDGGHGDRGRGDNIFSLTIEAPPVVGEYVLTFFRILPDQSELKSASLKFRIQD